MSNKELPPLETLRLTEAEYRSLNRRSFFTWIGVGLAGILGLRTIFKAEEDRGIPWPLRRVGEFGESVWKSQFHDGEVHTRNESVTGKARLNGDVGIDSGIDGASWTMKLSSPTFEEDFKISLAELRKLPQVTETFEFKCVEGWSQWMTFTGVRFSEFLKVFGAGADFPQYAALTSVDGAYYVAMDLKSLLHPQTLLCLSMNGEPLSHAHGFPVRLVSAVKYGVKNLKQIGSIAFTETIPRDYWAENGYSEYLGL